MDKSKTELVSFEAFSIIAQTKEIEDVIHIDLRSIMMLVTYNNKVSADICEGLGVDYKEAGCFARANLKQTTERESTFSDVSIAIASAVTAYARVTISKAKLDILSKGGELYYSDTDSIVTNVPLDEDMIGDKLGQFKAGYKVKRGYFIDKGGKIYCLILESGTDIIKVRGLSNHNLNEADFKRLHKGENVQTMRSETYRNYSAGYVKVKVMKSILLRGDSYVKRTKKFVDNVWVDTSPLTHNEESENSDSD